MSPEPDSGQPRDSRQKADSSSRELQRAAARMRVYELERLDYTDAATTAPRVPERDKKARRRSLWQAFYYWVHSRL